MLLGQAEGRVFPIFASPLGFSARPVVGCIGGLFTWKLLANRHDAPSAKETAEHHRNWFRCDLLSRASMGISLTFLGIAGRISSTGMKGSDDVPPHD